MSAPLAGSSPAAAGESQTSISQRLAAFAQSVTYEALPARVRSRAKLHMLDVIGTACAATLFDFAHKALASLRALGDIAITTRDGRELAHMERINRGAGERALSEDDISQKFFDNAALVLSRDKAQRVRAVVLDLERHSAAALAG